MDRKLAILLSLCLGIVCAFVNYLGKMSTGDLDESVSSPVVISCEQLLEAWPKDNYHLLLTEYQRGKFYQEYDYDQDGNWEMVYVPLFPAQIRELGNNFSSVIVYFDDVRNEEELAERLSSGEIDSQLWYTQQTLPTDVHTDLAHKYRLMNFSGCVTLQGGFTPPSPRIGKSAILGSTIGMIACGIIAVWNMIAMLLPKRRKRNFMDDEDESPIRNRAGLPDF